MKYIVVTACHFKNEKELCETTIARLKIAINIARKEDRIIVTGDVPYTIYGPKLGKLMRDWLISNSISEGVISIEEGGVGAFSEARLTCASLRDKDIIVVSSGWYFFYAKPIWQRRARENNISISFAYVKNTGGWRTILLYGTLGVIVRVAIFIGLENFIENYMTTSGKKRRYGFTFNGCGWVDFR